MAWKLNWKHSPEELPKEVSTGAIFPTLQIIVQLLENVMSSLDDLTAQVAASVGVEQSAVTLIQGLAAKIDALIAAGGGNAIDPAALDALSKQLHDSADALAAAVTAGARPDASPTPPAAPTAAPAAPADGSSAPAAPAAPAAS